MPAVLVIDSGTTTTRVRLWDGTAVVASASEPVGARNTAIDGHNGQVREAITRLINRVMEGTGVTPEAVLCSGMITANVGLLEVPHILAPVSALDLARRIVAHPFPEISSLPFYFIPGIKTMPPELNAQTLSKADILRGEEAEATGLRELLGLIGPVMLVHYGSHHKAIAVDGEGQVLYSRTSVTGELLMAIMQNTILKASTLALDQVELDEAMWRTGLDAALSESDGFGRALFLTRVVEQIWHRSKGEATSFLLGVLLSLDIPLLAGVREQGAAVVLYGKGHFPRMMKAYLDSQGWPSVHLVDESIAELSSVVGAVRIFERWQELHQGSRP